MQADHNILNEVCCDMCYVNLTAILFASVCFHYANIYIYIYIYIQKYIEGEFAFETE
jgi:hypothetical protein